MRRRTTTIRWVCAALILAATLALWVRGYYARDGLWYTTASTRYGVHNYRGRVLLWRLSVAPTPTK